jgi:hypothetical protein
MPFCIPRAQGVPGFSNQPPYWLPGHPTFPENTELDDPRWRGAYRRNINGDVAFRALYHDAPPHPPTGDDVIVNQRSLYLSWHALFVPDLDDANDLLYVGLQASTGGTAMVIRIQVHSGETAQTAANVHSISVFTSSGGAWSSVADPTWIDANTRAWVMPGAGTTGAFAVQMRIPIGAGGTINHDAGPNLGEAFNLWYALRGHSAAGPIILAEAPFLGTTALNFQQNNYPAAASWDRVSTIAGDPACPTEGGIVLSSLDVGTTNTPASNMLYDPSVPVASRPVNTFFARPRNYTGASIPAGGISANFRIANWGSIAAPSQWVAIPGGSSVASAASIPAITPGSPPPATNPISFQWRLDDNDIATFITGATPHKCILVELDGPNLTFFNESVYRNMNFVTASIFRQDAEINIRGLAPISGGAPRRDVFLAIEHLNMPEKVESDRPREEEVLTPAPDTGEREIGLRRVSRAEAVADAKRGQVEEELLQRFMPTCRIRVYHDTGERLDGRPVLRPQTYFGYFVEHEGPLVGWRQSLQAPPEAQLQELAPKFYKIVVPNDGVAKVTTVIQAVETDETPGGGLPDWLKKLPLWLQILILIIVLLLIIWLLV